MTDPPPPHRLTRLSLRGKLLIPLIILIATIFVVVGLGVVVGHRTNQLREEISAVYLPQFELATAARDSFAKAKYHALISFFEQIETRRDLNREIFFLQIDRTEGLLQQIAALPGAGPASRAKAVEVGRQIADYGRDKMGYLIAEAARGQEFSAAARRFLTRIDIAPAMDRLVEDARVEIAETQEAARRYQAESLRNVSILSGLALLVSLYSMRRLLRTQLADPLRRLHARMIEIAAISVERQAARADRTPDPALTQPVPELERGDELGGMAAAVDLLRRDKLLAVTLTRALQETRTEMVEQAKMASLGALVAGVAHEINTPIGICVTGSSGMMDDIRELTDDIDAGRLDPTRLRETMERIHGYAELVLSNMTRAGAQVASFKQISVDQTTEAVRSFELGDYARSIVEALRPELVRAKATVVVDCPEPASITAPPAAIWQILSNLVLNATRHAFGAGFALDPLVTIAISREAGRVQIEVKDNGVGVPDHIRPHVFEPFFTTSRGSGGSGLGLTIVYNLVTMTLHGRIACISEAGSGARFLISFPER